MAAAAAIGNTRVALAHVSAIGENHERERREPRHRDPAGIVAAIARALIAGPLGSARLRPKLGIARQPGAEIAFDPRSRIGGHRFEVMTAMNSAPASCGAVRSGKDPPLKISWNSLAVASVVRLL